MCPDFQIAHSTVEPVQLGDIAIAPCLVLSIHIDWTFVILSLLTIRVNGPSTVDCTCAAPLHITTPLQSLMQSVSVRRGQRLESYSHINGPSPVSRFPSSLNSLSVEHETGYRSIEQTSWHNQRLRLRSHLQLLQLLDSGDTFVSTRPTIHQTAVDQTVADW